MFRPRIIPVLLIKDKGLVKSVKFKNHHYIGDPINAAKIYSNLRADELIILDIEASNQKRLIDINLIKELGEETNMPLSVGGGIKTLDDIRLLLESGAEKVIINTHAIENPNFIREASKTFGSSTICVCIDVKKNIFSKENVFINNGEKSTPLNPLKAAILMEKNGAGEIIIQSINHDGTMNGYDLKLIKEISKNVSIPVVALGGASSLENISDTYKNTKVSGLAAASIFVYRDIQKGVLINYPNREKKMNLFKKL
ncbi:MAG: AglZ/HisF2 family acetamidino modification protein [Bacteroidia bacterium]